MEHVTSTDDSSSSLHHHHQFADSHDDVRAFFTKRPVHPDDLAAVLPVVSPALLRIVEKVEQTTHKKDPSAESSSSLDDDDNHHDDDNDAKEHVMATPDDEDETTTDSPSASNPKPLQENDGTAINSPRDYQIKLLEIAQEQNTIVHLGTGMGKTFVGILLLRHFLAATGKAVFLVPSVALAVQQAQTLAAHLKTYTVKTASQYTVVSSTSRQQLAQADVLVATHGAYLKLLEHDGDLFSIRQLSLLIVDECHHCTGKSDYVTIFQHFYHEMTPVQDRPRVLGLTASPLINVKPRTTVQQLDQQVSELERMLDSRIVSMKALGIRESDASLYLNREVCETIISYSSTSDPASLPPPRYDPEQVHKCRHKELNQLEPLFVDLGPTVVAMYCSAAAREMKRNEFEEEQPEQFQNAVNYLHSVASWCQQHCDNGSGSGVSEKLQLLQDLLTTEFGKNSGAVGLLFVQRRITAAALNLYFRSLQHKRGFFVATESKAAENVHAQSADSRAATPEEDQFMDAEDDVDFNIDFFRQTKGDLNDEYQFADASEDEEMDLYDKSPTTGKGQYSLENKAHVIMECPIRPVTLIGVDTTKKVYGKVGSEEMANELWKSEREAIADALRGLRCNEFNLLIATAVVEEGIDIQTCNFVIVFDELNSLKSYVQMKGRARQRNAAVFVFEEQSSTGALVEKQEAEQRVYKFLVDREYRDEKVPDCAYFSKRRERVDQVVDPDKIEMLALQQGLFCTASATLTMRDAKSLLYQFVIGQLDDVARASRSAFQTYQPIFDDRANTLTMPAYMGTSKEIRVVHLPPAYAGCNKKEREQVLCFLTCIRLHGRGLLNQRLRPLSKQDIKQRVLEAVYIAPSPRNDTCSPASGFSSQINNDDWFVTPLLQNGVSFDRFKKALQSDGMSFGILSRGELPAVAPLSLPHKDFGSVSVRLGCPFRIPLSDINMEQVSAFFASVFNARWKKRTLTSFFRARLDLENPTTMAWYGCVLIDEPKQSIQWEKMNEIVKESSRTALERREAIMTMTRSGQMVRPRLWSPTYNRNAVYIAHRPSGLCSDSFPNTKFTTFAEFYEQAKKVHVDPQAQLYECEQLWDEPRRAIHSDIQSRKRRFEATQERENGRNGTSLFGLRRVKLPPSCCIETPVADPSVYLLLLFLPQFLHHMEAYMHQVQFLLHCKVVLPQSARLLAQIPAEQLIAALSTKSYHGIHSYEKLEWLGDAVLKVVLSDALMQSPQLGSWVQLLTEGYLSQARDALACNATLTDVCKRFNLDRFILSRSLSRGKWAPFPLCLADKDGAMIEDPTPSGKVCADIIEALIGLVYVRFGIDPCRLLVTELGLTSHSSESFAYKAYSEGVSISPGKLDAAKRITGQDKFNSLGLVEEAFCHPTALGTHTPSYQRLEWIGDAVLCLASREWIFDKFPDRSVGDMVVTEALLNSNEALAYLSHRHGLIKHLDHLDQTLQTRLDAYSAELTSKQGGLWGTVPPKALADMVESLLGLVHVDCGFHAAQKAARHILAPILEVVESDDNILVHPKSTLKEMAGHSLSVEMLSGDTFSKIFPTTDVWNGCGWGPPGKGRVVARLHGSGETVMAACGTSKAAAVNSVCNHVLAVAERIQFKERLKKARGVA